MNKVKFNDGINLRIDMKSLLRKLELLPKDPLVDLMEALNIGWQKSVENFSKPDQLVVNPTTFKNLQKHTFKRDNLKP